MRAARFVRIVITSAAIVGMCLSQVAFAVEPPPAVGDIALGDGGVLHGRLVNLQGGSVADVPVALRAQNRPVATTTTTADGSFSVKGLKGGVYHVAAAQGNGVYRLWSARTAPPAAKSAAIVYTQHGTGGGGLKGFITNPIVIAGVVATAIAVPVALANSSHASP
jgi:hypothetical protein